MPAKTCAVIGGGINGVMAAWALAQAGHRVELFEKGRLMAATSSASTKLLHGGLRYLETGQFRLVREALQERAWWIAQAPHLAQPIRLILPIYENSARPAWLIRAGLILYDFLAAGSGFPRHRQHTAAEIQQLAPNLKPEGLLGGFSYYDAQMDDHELGLWAAGQAEAAGATFREGAEVTHIDIAGTLRIGDEIRRFDHIINVAGPWAERLLKASGIASCNRLDLVRGSHILFDEPCPNGCFLQIRGEQRIFFVLPYQGKTLVGTTEVRQEVPTTVECTDEEARYLVGAYNSYFAPHKQESDICGRFSGLRPLISSRSDLGRASREYVIERQGKVLSVFGGKWTTARKLGLAVARHVGV